MKSKLLLKLIFAGVSVLLMHNANALKLYWIGASDTYWNNYANWSESSGIPNNPSFLTPSPADTVFFDANSFPSGGEVVTITTNSACKMLDFSALDFQIYTTLPTLVIDNTYTLSIKDAIFSSKIHLNINGTLYIDGQDYAGGTMNVDFKGATVGSSLKLGKMQFGIASGTFNLLNDLVFIDGYINVVSGNLMLNKNLKCRTIDFLNGVSGPVALTCNAGSVLEFSGDVLMDNITFLTHNLNTANATIILSGTNFGPFQFDCSNCDFSNTSVTFTKGSYYNLNTGVLFNDLLFNTITLEDSTRTNFNNNAKLKFNSITTTATMQNVAYTVFDGYQGGSNAGLEDRDGGVNCLYNVTMNYWTVTNGQVNVSSPGWVSATNSGNFKDKFKGFVKDATSGLPAPNGYVKLFKEVSAYGKLRLVDSVTVSPTGEYELNPSNYIDGGTYRLWASSTGLLEAYYARPVTLKDSSVFLWSDAFQYTGLGCGDSIADTMNLRQPLIAAGTGFVAGVIKEGVGYQMKIIDPSNTILTPGQPIKGVKVGLGKNPPGSVASIAITDNTGKYSFSDLPPGNYTVYVDVEGLDLISTYTLTITGSDSLLNRDFIADSATVYANNMFVGFNNSTKQQPGLTLFPNPSSSNIYINYESIVGSRLNIEIENMIGQTLYLYSESVTQFGNQTFTLDLNEIHIPPGTFFIKTNINNTLFVNKIVKK